MVFFVTGGSRGLGEAVVMEAVRQGHDVGFTFHTSEKRAADVCARASAARPDVRCTAYPLDVRSSAAVETIGDRFLDEFGTVDVVVANAGINKNNLVLSMSDDEWDDVLRTNLTGAFYVCRQFMPTMLANHFGRIILMSSLGHSGVSGQANYCASKAGLHGLCSSMAKEYGRKGITTNVVVPGFFDTDMSRDGMSASNKEFWIQYCPVGRMGELPEIAHTVMFLASKGASFINGQTIPVTGGLDWAP
jgi:NAD(P)-dependent dehydrogenase (short-subunit alcohol dehydrogenase family)